GLLVLGASWLDRALGWFGPARVGGSRLWYPPRYRTGPGMKWGPPKPEFQPRLPSVRTRGLGCACAHFPFKYSADWTLALLQLARDTVTSGFNPTIGRKHHERSRNGGAF